MTTPTPTVQVVSNVIPILITGLVNTVGELMAGVPHVIARPDQRKIARYRRATKTTIAIHVGRVEARNDASEPLSAHRLVGTVNFDLHVTQKLVASAVFGYTQTAHQRLWSIASFLASRLHRGALIATNQIGVVDITGVTEDEQETQDRIGYEGFVVSGVLRVQFDNQPDLGTLQYPETEAPIILSADVSLEPFSG